MLGDVAAGLHRATVSQSCLRRNDWICAEYVTTRRDDLVDALTQHTLITVAAVVLGVLAAVPLAVLVRRNRGLTAALTGTATVIYTIPSLALLAFLFAFPFLGLSNATVVVALALYSLAILLRNTLDGLAAVPGDAVDAARGMGYGAGRLLTTVELPLALPAILAGVRIATVSTVALATLGTIVGHGGFGDLIDRGLQSNFRSEVLTATAATVLLALALDAVLLAVQRALTPWSRSAAA
ncbi:MAG: ABC transporter permease [Kineosporiaceae bacterium]